MRLGYSNTTAQAPGGDGWRGEAVGGMEYPEGYRRLPEYNSGHCVGYGHSRQTPYRLQQDRPALDRCCHRERHEQMWVVALDLQSIQAAHHKLSSLAVEIAPPDAKCNLREEPQCE